MYFATDTTEKSKQVTSVSLLYLLWIIDELISFTQARLKMYLILDRFPSIFFSELQYFKCHKKKSECIYDFPVIVTKLLSILLHLM